jgi:hypothetical protein
VFLNAPLGLGGSNSLVSHNQVYQHIFSNLGVLIGELLARVVKSLKTIFVVPSLKIVSCLEFSLKSRPMRLCFFIQSQPTIISYPLS